MSESELDRLSVYLANLRHTESVQKATLKSVQDEIAKVQRKIIDIVEKQQMSMNEKLFGEKNQS